MSYQDTAAALVEKVGGKQNVDKLTHCVTRLRFVLKDESKADLEAIKNIEGVLDCIVSSGQYQVVIGPAVADVYKATLPLLEQADRTIPAEKAAGQAAPQKARFSLKAMGKSALDTVISCFAPAIPIISGSGMIKVLVVLLDYAGILPTTSTTSAVLSVIGDGVFYFLPFLVAINAARKMDVDLFASVALAAIVLHPNLMALGEVGTNVGFLGLRMPIMNYSAQALPIIFGVWLLKYVDKFADKISPNLIKVFSRTMIDLLLVAPAILLLIGPISIAISNGLFAACVLMQSWGWLAVGINGFLFPLMVLTGTHNATIPLIVQLFATQGYDSIFLVGGLAANMSQAGAAFAVALRTKNKTMHATALSSTLSALLGVTEPALYGVNLRLKKPFIAVLLGSLIGGTYCGMLGLRVPTFLTPSVLTSVIFVPPGGSILLSLTAVPVCFAIAFVISYILGFEDLPADK